MTKRFAIFHGTSTAGAPPFIVRMAIVRTDTGAEVASVLRTFDFIGEMRCTKLIADLPDTVNVYVRVESADPDPISLAAGWRTQFGGVDSSSSFRGNETINFFNTTIPWSSFPTVDYTNFGCTTIETLDVTTAPPPPPGISCESFASFFLFGSSLVGLCQLLGSLFNAATKGISDAIKPISDPISRIITPITTLSSSVVSFAASIVNLPVSIAQNIVDRTVSFFNPIVTGITSLSNAILNALISSFTTLTGPLIPLIQSIQNIFNTFLQQISAAISGIVSQITAGAASFFEPIITGFQGFISQINEKLGNFRNDFSSFGAAFDTSFSNAFQNFVPNLQKGLEDITKGLANIGLEVGKSFASASEELGKATGSFQTTAVASLSQAATGAASAGEAFTQIASGFQFKTPEIKDVVFNIANALSGGILNSPRVIHSINEAIGRFAFAEITAYLIPQGPATFEDAKERAARFEAILLDFTTLQSLIAAVELAIPDAMKFLKMFQEVFKGIYWAFGFGWLQWVVMGPPLRAGIAEGLEHGYRKQTRPERPTREMLDEWHRRGFISEDDYRDFLAERGFRDEDINRIQLASTPQLSVAHLFRLRNKDIITEETLQEQLRKRGFTGEDRALLAKLREVGEEKEEKDASLGTIRRWFKLGVIGETDFRVRAKSLGVLDKDVELEVKAIILDKLEDTTKIFENEARAAFRSGEIQGPELLTALRSLGDTDEVAFTKIRLENLRRLKALGETFEQLRDQKIDTARLAFRRKAIEETQLRGILAAEGVDFDVIQDIVEIETLKRLTPPDRPLERELSQAQILEAFRRAVRDETFARTRLRALGMPEPDIDVLIALNTPPGP